MVRTTVTSSLDIQISDPPEQSELCFKFEAILQEVRIRWLELQLKVLTYD